MGVKVLITRQFKEELLHKAYEPLMELRSVVTLRRGYVSGETLVSSEDKRTVLVISHWSSRERWEEWLTDPRRQEFVGKMAELLESPEKVEIFLDGANLPIWAEIA
ncbi:MAG TPA: antibiotic biosynthesis monooxygenase [Desulfomonilaceae bacterium]|nr:antibiotic biosynthesis monooxygenase [Desulfomonilaceae bacterium]